MSCLHRALLLALPIAIGCGRSPAMPKREVRLVRVESGQAPPCADADDDDDCDDVVVRKPVEYVPMSEWQPPPAAQRAEASVIPRGDEPPAYTRFPNLTLHRPIGESTVTRVPRYWR